MKIAIIGAGFAGLSLGFYLTTSGAKVDLFEAKGIGAGASGVASGLVHPYVGESARRSLFAQGALTALKNLLDEVEKESGECFADRMGIIRYAQTQEQQEALSSACEVWKDVRCLEDGGFFIESGLTLHCREYLQALCILFQKRGGKLILSHVTSLEALQGYDVIVIAAGEGIRAFAECKTLPCRFVKGQVWIGKGASLLEKSTIGKGYVALGKEKGTYCLGSTYEHDFTTSAPDFEKGKEETLQNIAGFFPDVSSLSIEECRAGVRVTRVGHYFPLAIPLNDKIWAFTGLGSRGILYHACLAKALSERLLK